MASEVEICSAALNMLGDEPITSLTDNSDRARLCNRFYSIERDALLRAHPWNSAIARESLALLSATPVNGWAKQFQLPADPYCLRVLTLNEDPSADDPGDDFVVEGRALLTDATSATIKFIKRITDPNDFDPMLYDALIARLAWRLAIPITGKRTIARDAFEQYSLVMAEARSIDGQEGTPDKLISDDLTSVR